jgi:hypothetical protein
MDFGHVLTEADGEDYLDNWCTEAISMEIADAGLRPVTAQPATRRVSIRCCWLTN